MRQHAGSLTRSGRAQRLWSWREGFDPKMEPEVFLIYWQPQSSSSNGNNQHEALARGAILTQVGVCWRLLLPV